MVAQHLFVKPKVMKRVLSKREEQVLKLLLAEYSQNEICEALDLSYSRVNDVKMIIMKKWGVETMVGLVLESIRLGFLEVEVDCFENELVTDNALTPMLSMQAS